MIISCRAVALSRDDWTKFSESNFLLSFLLWYTNDNHPVFVLALCRGCPKKSMACLHLLVLAPKNNVRRFSFYVQLSADARSGTILRQSFFLVERKWRALDPAGFPRAEFFQDSRSYGRKNCVIGTDDRRARTRDGLLHPKNQLLARRFVHRATARLAGDLRLRDDFNFW